VQLLKSVCRIFSEFYTDDESFYGHLSFEFGLMTSVIIDCRSVVAILSSL